VGDAHLADIKGEVCICILPPVRLRQCGLMLSAERKRPSLARTIAFSHCTTLGIII
jgi:hypothetical protein